MTRLTDIICVFRIQFAGTRREVGPFLLAAFVFPTAMYLFANAIAGIEVAPEKSRLRFLAGSIVSDPGNSSVSIAALMAGFFVRRHWSKPLIR